MNMKKFTLDYKYLKCEDEELRDKMFIMELRKYQNYYIGSIEPVNRKLVKETFDIQMNTVIEYLDKIRKEK